MRFHVPNRELLSSLRFERKEARTLAFELGLKHIGFASDILNLNNGHVTEIMK